MWGGGRALGREVRSRAVNSSVSLTFRPRLPPAKDGVVRMIWAAAAIRGDGEREREGGVGGFRRFCVWFGFCCRLIGGWVWFDGRYGSSDRGGFCGEIVSWGMGWRAVWFVGWVLVGGDWVGRGWDLGCWDVAVGVCEIDSWLIGGDWACGGGDSPPKRATGKERSGVPEPTPASVCSGLREPFGTPPSF